MKGVLKFLQYFAIAIAGKEKNFTSGSINKAIFLLSIPMILEMVMESLFAVVDVFFVGKIGMEAVATVGLTESVLTIIYSIAIGLSMAATAMVARRVGEGKPIEAGKVAAQAFVLTGLLSFLIALAGFFFAEDILRFMGGSESLIASGKGYTRIMFSGNMTIMFLFLINAIFRGAGDASIAMRSLWIANILNILLDPLLILGWGPVPAMGIEGAAIATTIGRGIGVAYQCYMLFSNRSVVVVRLEELKVRWKIIINLIKVSLGGMGQFLISSASWIFLIRIISAFGSDALAGYTIAVRIIIFTILPSWGLANAAATLVGQNLGANQPKRAEQSVWNSAFINMIFLAVVSVVFFIGAKDFMLLFSDNVTVVHYGVLCLRYLCVGYVFFAYGMVISQAFNGAGDTRTPTIINLICFWCLQIPLAYLFATHMEYGPEGVFAAMVLSEASLAIISILIFRKGRWKLMKV